MSKSLGNVIPLAVVPRRYGADLFRLYISQVADLPSLVDWREKDVITVRRRFNRLLRIFQEASKYPDEPLDERALSMSGRWILSKINTTIKMATESLDNFRFRTYILQAFFQLMSHIEFYLRRSKKKNAERGPIFRYIVKRWVKLLTPVMPHLCEEIWETLGNISFVSLETWPAVDEALIDERIENVMEVINNTITDIKEIKGLLKEKKVNTVHIYISPKWKYKAFSLLHASDAALTVKELMPVVMTDATIRKRGKDANELVQAIVKAGGYWTFVDKEIEYQAFIENSDFIEAETGLTVKIQDAENPTEDPANRAPKALPGRPALFIE